MIFTKRTLLWMRDTVNPKAERVQRPSSLQFDLTSSLQFVAVPVTATWFQYECIAVMEWKMVPGDNQGYIMFWDLARTRFAWSIGDDFRNMDIESKSNCCLKPKPNCASDQVVYCAVLFLVEQPLCNAVCRWRGIRGRWWRSNAAIDRMNSFH